MAVRSWTLAFILLVSWISSSAFARRQESNGADPLGMDQALLTVAICSEPGHMGIVEVFAQNTNCWNCTSISILKLQENHTASNGSTLLYSNHSTALLVNHTLHGKVSTVCIFTRDVTEHAHYDLHVSIPNTNPINSSCVLTQLDTGDNSNIIILYALLMLLGAAVAWNIVLYCYRKQCFSHALASCCSSCNGGYMGSSEGLVTADLGVPSPKPRAAERQEPEKERFKSLDVFRGLSLALMIFVNYGGGGYWFFSHSEWNGLTVADLLFPWFVFIMGTAVPFGLAGVLQQRKSRGKAFCKILTRSLMLFALGLFFNSKRGNDLSTIRVMGVLQRLALSYFVVALVGLATARRSSSMTRHEGKWWSGIRDLVYCWPQLLVMMLLLLLHIGISLFVPYDPACPIGYLGPGGLHDYGAHWNCTAGIARYIDIAVLGEQHIYLYPTCKDMYQCVSHDPEGLLGTLTSIVICFLGMQAGKIYVLYKRPKSRILRWFLWAVVTGGLTLLLTKCSQNDGWVPINKNLWSASFVLALASMAYLVLIVLHILIDILGVWNGSPFYYAGVNSIAVYIGSELLSRYVPISFYVSDDHTSQLFMNIWSVTFFHLAALYMHSKRLFISI